MTYLPLRVDAGGNGRVVLWDASGNPLLGTAQAAGDAIANPTLGGLLAFPHFYDGATWRRARTSTITDAQAEHSTPIVGAVMLTKDGNGAGTYPVRSLTGGGDSISPGYRGPVTVPLPMVYNPGGDDWDRIRSYETISGVGATGIPAQGIAAFQIGTSTVYPICGSDAAGGGQAGRNILMTGNRVMIASDDFPAQRGNTTEATALAVAARTSSISTGLITNPNGTGLVAWLAVAANPGGGETLQLGVDSTNDTGGTWVGLHYSTTFTFGGGGGVLLLLLDPGSVTALAHTYNTRYQSRLPQKFRFSVVHSAGGSWTYGLNYSILV